jgi:divalent metal cation (Fe/Co/Zn/Cd) transporter
VLTLTILLTIALTTYWGIPGGAWALIGTIVSGLILAAGTKFFNRNADKRDDRKIDLAEIKELRERIDEVEAEVFEWRERYYQERNHSARLERQLIDNGLEPRSRPKDE